MRPSFSFSLAAALCAGLMVAACGSNPERERRGPFSGLFGSGSQSASSQQQVGIGVNSFLWRASLDTLSFMPLSQLDPYGGVIITDWHADPGAPDERFMATVYILDSRLRGDALSVQLFRQVRDAGEWRDAELDPATRIQVENAILTRARQLRISQLDR